MARPEKVEAVAELKDAIECNSIAIMTAYQGINVADVTTLRAKLREQNVKFKVYKNTLAERALNELGLSDAFQYMEGPTAWAFCADPVKPAKILKEFSKTVEKIAMRGGILDGRPVSRARLESLAELPPKEQLIAQAVGTMAMPLRKFLGTLSALPRNLMNVLDQIKQQKEGAAA